HVESAAEAGEQRGIARIGYFPDGSSSGGNITLSEARRSARVDVDWLTGAMSTRPRGFTLIEVLAAIALLAIAFAIALSALGKSAQNAARATALDAAVEHAQSLFAEQGLMAPLKDASTEGSFDDAMRWTLKVHMLPRPAQNAAAAVPLQQGGAMMA